MLQIGELVIKAGIAMDTLERGAILELVISNHSRFSLALAQDGTGYFLAPVQAVSHPALPYQSPWRACGLPVWFRSFGMKRSENSRSSDLRAFARSSALD